jgi:RimJ/RimL family protein N-acetyltransferase
MRLVIRPFVKDDLAAAHELIDNQLYPPGESLEARRDWLTWCSLNPGQLAALGQPPYGDRAITLRTSGALIGMVGYVPCLDAFDQLKVFRGQPDSLHTAEVGLYWAVAPAHREQGIATEAAQALIDFGFEHLPLKRIIATTEYDNFASQAVMRKLGMELERNPYDSPPWLQIVGLLENPRSSA